MNARTWIAAIGSGPGPRRGVAWLGGLFIAVIVGLAAYDIVRGYRVAVEQTGHELEAQSRVIAEQTARSVQAVDVLLKHLVEQLERGALAHASRDELHAYLKEQAVGLVQVDGLVVFAPDGTVRAVSQVPSARLPPLDVSRDQPFASLRDAASSGLRIDNVRRSPGTGHWVFPIARRLVNSSGGFAGAVGAPGKVEYFQQFYGDAYPDPSTRIALLHRDGWLLARHPPADAALGQRMAALEALLPASGAAPVATRGSSPIDGVERFASIRFVPDYPLVVVVTRDAAAALAPWRSQALGSALRTLALAALAASLLALALRQLSRLQAARTSLEVSRERYALAAAGSDDGIWDWDLRAGTAYESRRARELQGLPLQPETQPLAELRASLTYHPDDAHLRAAAMQAHLDGDAPAYEVEYRVRHPDGAYRWIHVRALCIRDADGKPIRLAGSVTDIDARKRAEVARRESEERFAVAVAGSDDGIWDWNYAAGRAFASQRAREILGLPEGPEQQSIDAWFAQMERQLHPDDLARRNAALAEHLAGRTPAYAGDFRVRDGRGGWRWVRVHGMCVRDAQGQPLRIAGSVSDIDASKRAEHALRISEERYALAMTGSRGGHWVWEADSDALFVSGTVNELFGLPADTQPTTRSDYFARITLHPDDRRRVQRIGDELLQGRAARADFEYRILLDGGRTVRWILTRAQAFAGSDGHGLRVAGVSVDITERKRTEEALRLSEERFALAVAGSSDGILDWDIVNDRMFTSLRAMRIAGVESDVLVRTRAEWVALLQIHPDDVQRHADDFRRHLEGATEVREGDYRVRHPDGVYRWVRVRGMSVRDADGRAIRWAGSVSDIDEQKRTEQALRRSEERYQLAVDGSNEGLWDWDVAIDMLFLSARAQQLVAAEAGEPLRRRRDWIALTEYHPDDAAAVRRALAAHLRGSTPHFSIECRLRHHSGEWRWYRQRGIALRDGSGRAYRMAGSMEDISARKHAEAERLRLEQQLRQAQKLEAIGTLAGGIAHDFNNILSAILGYGEMVQKGAGEGTPLRRHIDAAMSAGLRAKSLVERILAFSRGGTAERVTVPVQAVVDEALDSVAGALPARLRLQRALDAADAGVLGDATQIHQVVMNLCANAAQAMKGDGVLAVSLDVVALDAPLAVTTSTLPAGRYVRLRVADSGSGIEPQWLDRIFDPFFTTKQVGVGTGLGLSLVHGIVTDLGGGIGVASRVGQGTTFSIWLPWQSWQAAPAAADERIEPGNGETVLFVDDEESLVRLGEETLAELGYEPVGFASALDALAAFRAAPQRFDAVLSDEAMPGMTGSELLAEIRKLRPALAVVLMTGFVNAAIAARAREAGVADVLVKPLVSRDIARCLAAVLGRDRAARSGVAEATARGGLQSSTR